MKKKVFNVIFVSVVLLFILTGCNDGKNNSSTNKQNGATKMQTNIEATPTPKNEVTEIKKNATGANEEINISEFTTKIYNKESPRQNNMQITCRKLNGAIVKTGEVFSFEAIVGKATAAEGYQESDIFDKDGNKIKGLGGGNCQVSTTLYNAILKAENLEVTERHEHSNYVPYIEDGKDAAVAYGSCDLKFVNNNSYDIKIYAESLEDNVNIRIVKI